MVPTGAPGVATVNPVAPANELVVSMPPSENGNNVNLSYTLKVKAALYRTSIFSDISHACISYFVSSLSILLECLSP